MGRARDEMETRAYLAELRRRFPTKKVGEIEASEEALREADEHHERLRHLIESIAAPREPSVCEICLEEIDHGDRCPRHARWLR